jgi:hypothetical protein
MAFVIRFTTSMFDVSKEDENSINPIAGQSLLVWLKSEISGEKHIPSPECEDWGWYTFIEWNGRNYLLGSIAYYEIGDEPNAELEWLFQIDKTRSFLEKIKGKEKMTLEDECLRYIKRIFDENQAFNNVELEES